jgi:hypothetical protein
MANPLDIFFRVKGDSSDAVRALDDTGKAAERATTQVGRTQAALSKLGDIVGTAFARGTGAFTAFEVLGQGVDRLLGSDQAVRSATQKLTETGSPEALASAFATAVQKRSQSFGETGGAAGFLKNIAVTLGRRATGDFSTPDYKREREALEAYDQLVRDDPARAQALLAADLGRYNYLKPQFQSRYQSMLGAKAWTEQLKGATTVNNYVSNIGADPRTVDRNQQRYTRTNGTRRP